MLEPRLNKKWSAYSLRDAVQDMFSIGIGDFHSLHLRPFMEFNGALPLTRTDLDCTLDISILPKDDGSLTLFLRNMFFKARQPERGFLVFRGELKAEDQYCERNQEIELVACPMPRVGVKWYFRCPLQLTGAGEFKPICGRRCAVLLNSRSLQLFGCRQCLNLRYRTNPLKRQVARAKKREKSMIAEYKAEHPDHFKAVATPSKDDESEPHT